MWNRFFRLAENGTNVRTELLAGLTTFLTMAYIIVVQPAVLSGRLTGTPTGMNAGAVMTATCLSAALATAIMGLYARYPVAQAPGMGENFFFVASAIPAAAAWIAQSAAAGHPVAAAAWQVALGVVFLSGVIFLALSLCGAREMLLNSISPSMCAAIAVGIGLFIAFIGLQGTGLVIADPGHLVKLDAQLASPDLVIFFVGLLVTGGLYALRVRGSIVLGMAAATAVAIALRYGLPLLPAGISHSPLVTKSMLMTHFAVAHRVVAPPPSLGPTFLRMDLAGAISPAMLPLVLIFSFMLMFDTLGTLIAVAEQAGFMKDNKLPRAKQAPASDAIATVAGAALGTSTVTSFIESAAGVEQGGRTGLTALTTAGLFLLALPLAPLVAMVGSYPSLTAPALVAVGSLMVRNVAAIDWTNHAEVLPAFLVMLGIPLSYSIADGLALGFIAYPVVKLLSGQGRQVKPLMYAMAVLLVAYFVLVRVRVG